MEHTLCCFDSRLLRGICTVRAPRHLAGYLRYMTLDWVVQERVYLLFVMTIGDSPDIIATLFSVPTIVICRASQRRLATERLGYPLSVYDDLRSRGCSYNLPSRKPGAMPQSPATPSRAAAAAAAAAVAAASAGVLEAGGGGAHPGMPGGLAVSAAVPLDSVAAGIALLAGGAGAAAERTLSGNGGALSPMALPMHSDATARSHIFDLAPQRPEVLAAHNGRALSAPPATRVWEGRSASDEERTQDDHDGGATLSGHKRPSASEDATVRGTNRSALAWMQGAAGAPANMRMTADDLTTKVARVGNSTPTAVKAEGAEAQSAALLKALPEKQVQALLQFYDDQQNGRQVSTQTQMDAMAALQKLQAAEAAAAAAAAAAATAAAATPAPAAAAAQPLQQVTQLRPWRLAPKAEPAPEVAGAVQPLQRTAVPLQPPAAAPAGGLLGAVPRGQQTSPVSDTSALSAFAQKRVSSSRAHGTLLYSLTYQLGTPCCSNCITLIPSAQRLLFSCVDR